MTMLAWIKKMARKALDSLIFFEIFSVPAPKPLDKKLLIVRIDALGDFVLFSACLPAYARLYPDHSITLVVSSTCVTLAKGVCAPFPNIKKIVPFDQRRFNARFLYKRRILKDIRNERSAIAIQPTFSRGYLGDLLIQASRALERIGYAGDASNMPVKQKAVCDGFYTRLIPIDASLSSEIDRNRHFVESLGGTVENPLPVLRVRDEEKRAAATMLAENGLPEGARYAIIQLGAGAPCRRWPVVRFAEIIRYLTGQEGLFCVLVGSREEEALSLALRHSLGDTARTVIDLTGKTDVTRLGAIAKGALFYFGNETGTLHLSAAVGTPTVCILGGGHFGRFFPYGNLTKNRIVYDTHMTCKNDNWLCRTTVPNGEPSPCIAGISVEQARAEIDDLLHTL